jgi:hypothetical protein
MSYMTWSATSSLDFVSCACRHKDHLTSVRIGNKPDIVPNAPKAFFVQNIYFIVSTFLNLDVFCEWLNKAEELLYGWLPSAYQHPEARTHDMDSRQFLYLKQMYNVLSGKLPAQLARDHWAD